MPDRLKNALLLGMTLLLCTLAAEGVLRVVAPQRVPRFPSGLFVGDPLLRYRLAPNFRGVASTGEYRTTLRTDTLGLREDRDYGKSGSLAQTARGEKKILHEGYTLHSASGY
jgi:hypothetical protein